MIKIISSLLIFVIYLFSPFAYSQDENTAPFLLICPDSRALGLGLAGVSSTPDGASMHWNPAKYGLIEDAMGFALSYTPWLRNLKNDLVDIPVILCHPNRAYCEE